MNKTPYDDLLVKALDLISNVLSWGKKFKKHIKKLTLPRFKIELNKNIIRVKAFETTPRGHFAVNYSPVKLVFKDDIEQDFFDNIKNLPIYLQDYSDVDFSAGYFIIRKKSAANRLMEGCADKNYTTSLFINKYIKSGELFDNLFYVYDITKEEYREEKLNHPERILTPFEKAKED